MSGGAGVSFTSFTGMLALELNIKAIEIPRDVAAIAKEAIEIKITILEAHPKATTVRPNHLLDHHFLIRFVLV